MNKRINRTDDETDRPQDATRIERDSMGDVEVPIEALYGAQTARALNNFPISGQALPVELVHALGLIKLAAARVNMELGLIEERLADAIIRAAEEVSQGKLDAHFPVDVYQTGSGTSSNMNANEVIANRANLILGGTVGRKSPVHPNDHVNLGQSSNDVFPSAIHVAVTIMTLKRLMPALNMMESELEAKAEAFDGIVKVGRTHLQDAAPIRLGQEFSGYAWQVKEATAWVRLSLDSMRTLALGGTAVGTGINSHPEFGKRAASILSAVTGIEFIETPNHFAAQGSQDASVRFSGSLRDLSVALMKIANDIRWLGSGPRSGLGELLLPEIQPGSSIMPGKVNPVMAEALIMVCAQVLGLDVAIATAGSWGAFELNTMLPLIGENLLRAVRILSGATKAFSEKLLSGLSVNVSGLREDAERSLGLAAALTPAIGYDEAAKVAQEAVRAKKTVRQVVLERHLVDEETLKGILDLRRLTEPGIPV